MKKTIKRLVLLSISVLLVSPSLCAAMSEADMQALAKQMSQLQNEVASLKQQLKEQQNGKHSSNNTQPPYKVQHSAGANGAKIQPRPQTQPVSGQSKLQPSDIQKFKVVQVNARPGSNPAPVQPNNGTVMINTINNDTATLERQSGPPPQISGPSTSTSLSYWPIDPLVPGRSLVSTGPYIGVPLEFSGSNLIINSPNINEDVTLLEMRKKINKRFQDLGMPEKDERSHLILSGEVEGQIGYVRAGHGSSVSDIDLTTAELDAYILGPSHWTTGLIAFGFDNNGASFIGNSRISNSRVFVNKAFITIGDFQKSPLYLTIGQLYVPFGVYSSNMITPPMTKTLGRTKERALVVGFWQQCENALFGSAYIFRGDSYAETQCGDHSCRINNGGLNFGFKFSVCDQFKAKIGAGVIANLADSVGMQVAAFGNTSPPPPPPIPSNEALSHRVPAYNINALISLGTHWDIIAEYVGASTHFAPVDMQINNHGAKPYTARGEVSYSFKICDYPAAIAVGYGHSRDTLALGLSKDRYSGVFNISFWRNTLESIEFRHDNKFPSSYTATGLGVSPISVNTTPNLLGRPDNAVTLQMDMYF